LTDDVRFVSGSGEAIDGMGNGTNGGMDAEFEFDGLVEARIEPDLAQFAVRMGRHCSECFEVFPAGGSTIRAEDFPTKLEEPRSCRLQKKRKDLPRIRGPFPRDDPRADVREGGVWTLPQPDFESPGEVFRGCGGMELFQAQLEGFFSIRGGGQVGQHRLHAVAQMLAGVEHDLLHVLAGLGGHDRFGHQRAENIARSDGAEDGDAGLFGGDRGESHPHHRVAPWTAVEVSMHLVIIGCGPFERVLFPFQCDAVERGARREGLP